MLSAEHDATTVITSALFIVCECWNTCLDSTLSQHGTIVNAPAATYFQALRYVSAVGKDGHMDTITGYRCRFCCYLEGATPTRFGPRPRNKDLGPSFSRIDLENSNHTNELDHYSVLSDTAEHVRLSEHVSVQMRLHVNSLKKMRPRGTVAMSW